MVRREKLRLKLADAITRVLQGHALTIPNAKRYCKRDVLCKFSIRRDTEITVDDWECAIEIAKLRRAKPIDCDQKRSSTPTTPPNHYLSWKDRVRRSIQKADISDLEKQTRLKILDSCVAYEPYRTKLRAWQNGLLDIV